MKSVTSYRLYNLWTSNINFFYMMLFEYYIFGSRNINNLTFIHIFLMLYASVIIFRIYENIYKKETIIPIYMNEKAKSETPDHNMSSDMIDLSIFPVFITLSALYITSINSKMDAVIHQNSDTSNKSEKINCINIIILYYI